MTDINIGAITESLNYKSDLDLGNTNASASAKNTIIGWSLPDYSAGEDISDGFIAPKDGVITGELSAAQGGYCQVLVNNTVVQTIGSESSQRCRGPFYIGVSKGDVIGLTPTANATILNTKFFPFKGSN